MSRQFAARFSGPCAHCDEGISAGQRVEFMDDDLVHVRCPKPAATCPKCFLVLPASGECGACDE